ncbi:uncharacterized protein N7496_004208 [Penicillium cataractarum]|uniref:Fe2OG dioxygenase domain-containing protein n=1 Tax=Penicillium cataractarum TaxID=2100454 RepID=A0A9W9SPI1_9EURO|nr:uncharacterized protein N7496_004208 [Penicillium cataractarum]KAJ5381780.1 hypothetical protein N7496_004208 [Penicillium cataractarum]
MELTVVGDFPLSEGSKRLASETVPTADHPSKRLRQSSETPQLMTEATLSQGVDEVEHRQAGPPAWSNSRQQIGDTIEWFHCMQGGAAHNGLKCTGVLLDADNGERSLMSDEVIITRTGGDCTGAGQTLSLKQNQSPKGIIIRSIMASLRAKKPVGVIVGVRNELLKVKIPHRYCVMDWFLITNVWMEKMGKYAGFRFRLEKLDLSTKGWWAEQGPNEELPLAPRNLNRPPPTRECSVCGKPSIQVYIRPGWMCLEPSCRKFWKIGNKEPKEFEYHPDFLNYRHPRGPDIPNSGPLVNVVDRNLEPPEGVADREEWRGIVCPECRKCIQRVTWDAWDCTDDALREPEETCCYRVVRRIREIPLQSILKGVRPYTRRQLQASIQPVIDKRSLEPYELRTYEIPNGGSITHFVSNPTINERADGPNHLFSELQRLDLGLKRYPLGSAQGENEKEGGGAESHPRHLPVSSKRKSSKRKSCKKSTCRVKGTLTCHFAVNYGVPYKYVVSVESRAFSDAPVPILTALGRLSWATEKAVTGAGGQYQAPNELLALGYFEQMSIGFHDDGEKGLGPTIATLSLGTRSRMHIRMKDKYYFGISKSHVATSDDPVLPGCINEKERRSLKKSFDKGQITAEDFAAQRVAMLRRPGSRHSPKLLSLELKHGDLVVMHGAALQKYYEHAVEPDNGLRFALTARYIETNSDMDRIKGSFKLQDNQIYDGQ